MTETTIAYHELTRIDASTMTAMKNDCRDKFGVLVRGYPMYVCEETGELYPLPHQCKLWFSYEGKTDA